MNYVVLYIYRRKRVTKLDLEVWRDHRYQALQIAESQLSRAVNYRGCKVGAAALMHDGRDYAFFGGANWMPGHDLLAKVDWMKVCAEADAVIRGVLRGYRRLIGVAVVGQPQEDSASGMRPPTLHPCIICRYMFADIRFHP